MSSADRESSIVSLVGDVDWQNAPHLRDRLNDLLKHGYSHITINMANVGILDSSGLATIISFNRRLRSRSGRLTIINAPDNVLRAMRQARLCELIPTVGANVMRHDLATIPNERPKLMRTLSVPCSCNDDASAAMSAARRKVSEMLGGFGLGEDDVFDLTLALGEALGNAFDHGQGTDGDDASITVSVSLYQDRVVAEVTDCGCGWTYKAGDELPTPSETRGRGIRLMTMLADAISISPKGAGKGTRVRLVKMLASSDAENAE